MLKVTFTESDHSYHFSKDGLRWQVPSVTGILAQAGITPDYSRFLGAGTARELGTEVHKAITNEISRGGLTTIYVRSDVAGYLKAFRQFHAESGAKILASEKLVWHESFGYAGTLDILCQFPGDAIPTIIDMKTCPVPDWTALQLAGYSHALFNMEGKITRRAGLQLKGDGKYKLRFFELESTDAHKFLHAMQTVKGLPQWKDQQPEVLPRLKPRSSKPTRTHSSPRRKRSPSPATTSSGKPKRSSCAVNRPSRK